MSKTRESILKQGAEAIRTLGSQLEGLEKVAEQHKLAREVMENLLKDGRISSEDFLDKLAELEELSIDELSILNKAIEIGTLDGQFKLAEISDEVSLEGLNPSETFLKNVLKL